MKTLFRCIALITFAVGLLSTISCNRCADGCVNGQCIRRTCECDLWYEGDRCDRSQLSSFVGYYRGTARNDTGSVAIGFNLSVGELPNVLVSDTLSLRLEFTNDTRFNVPQQEVWGREYSGEGEMLLDLISIRLEPSENASLGSSLIEAERRSM